MPRINVIIGMYLYMYIRIFEWLCVFSYLVLGLDIGASSATTSERPLEAAVIRGVPSYYQTQKETQQYYADKHKRATRNTDTRHTNSIHTTNTYWFIHKNIFLYRNNYLLYMNIHFLVSINVTTTTTYINYSVGRIGRCGCDITHHNGCGVCLP